MQPDSRFKTLVYPNNIGEIRPLARWKDTPFLTDIFGQHSFTAAILYSEEFKSLATSFSYEDLGYDVLLRGPGMEERGPIVDVTDGKIGDIQQASYNIRKSMIDISPLESDLRHHIDTWTQLFNRFAEMMIPCLGNSFEIQIKILQHDAEWFHKDKDVIGILPLGEDRASTVLEFETGIDSVTGEIQTEKLYPLPNSLVVTTPPQLHSSPVSDVPRACIAATKYSHNF